MRLYDLSIFAEPRTPGGRAAPTAADAGGALVTGARKLAQRFLIELLTEAGSMPLAPERGTRFLDELRAGGSGMAVGEIHAAFAFAVGAAQRALRLEEREEDPDDERFADAVLRGVELAPGSLTLRVELLSLAGERREIVLPVPALP